MLLLSMKPYCGRIIKNSSKKSQTNKQFFVSQLFVYAHETTEFMIFFGCFVASLPFSLSLSIPISQLKTYKFLCNIVTFDMSFFILACKHFLLYFILFFSVRLDGVRQLTNFFVNVRLLINQYEFNVKGVFNKCEDISA